MPKFFIFVLSLLVLTFTCVNSAAEVSQYQDKINLIKDLFKQYDNKIRDLAKSIGVLKQRIKTANTTVSKNEAVTTGALKNALASRISSSQTKLEKEFLSTLDLLLTLRCMASNPDFVKEYDKQRGNESSLFDTLDRMTLTLQAGLSRSQGAGALKNFQNDQFPKIPTEKFVKQNMDEPTIRALMYASGQVAPD